jgi:hypothetical protein
MTRTNLNPFERALLVELVRLGGSAKSLDMVRPLGEWSRRQAARSTCRAKGLVIYDRPRKRGGVWRVTDKGRDALDSSK